MASPNEHEVFEIRGAVARGWCQGPNSAKVFDNDLAEAIVDEVRRAFDQFSEERTAQLRRDIGSLLALLDTCRTDGVYAATANNLDVIELIRKRWMDMGGEPR